MESELRGDEDYQGAAGFGGEMTDDFGATSDVSGVGTYTAGKRVGGKTGSRVAGAASEEPASIAGDQFKKRRKRKKRDRAASAALRDQKELYVDYDAMVEDRAANAGMLHDAEIDDPDKFWELVVPDEEQEARDLNYVGPLSYRKVKRHQFVTHPRDRVKRKPFEWWGSDLSYIPLYLSSIKRSQWVTNAAREIGVGPSLFLMTQKAFAWLFLFLFVINIPVIMFYAKGSGDPTAKGPESTAFTDLFGLISLGNIGVCDYTCANINVAMYQKDMLFNCPYGTMRELVGFGL